VMNYCKYRIIPRAIRTVVGKPSLSSSTASRRWGSGTCSGRKMSGHASGTAGNWLDRTPISFACTACGKCCQGPTNVFINEAEANAISGALGITKFEFMRQYTEDRSTADGLLTSLKSKSQMNNSGVDFPDTINDRKEECVFLDGKKCSVYDVRPTGCRTYPFWPHILLGEAEWSEEASRCEGITLPVAGSLPLNAPVVSSDVAVRNLIVHNVHKRGLGPDWDYEDSIEFLSETEKSSAGLIDDFRQEFFETHNSNILFENSNIRVVDTTTPLASDAAGDAEIGDAADVADEESAETKLVTVRRLEFKDSLNITQSTTQLIDDNSGFRVADHSKIVMPVHAVMSAMLERQMLDIQRSLRAQPRPANTESFVRRSQTSLCGSVIGAGGCLLPMHLLHSWTRINSVNKLTVRCSIDAVDCNESILVAAKDFFGAKFEPPLSSSQNLERSDNMLGALKPVLSTGEEYLSSLPINERFHFMILDTFESCGSVDGERIHRAPSSKLAEEDALSRAIRYVTSQNGIWSGNGSQNNVQHGLLLINALGPDEWIDEILANVTNAARHVKDSINDGTEIAVTSIKVNDSPNRVICVSTHALVTADENAVDMGNNTCSADEQTDPAVNDWGEVLGVPAEIAVVEDCIFV
jgi:Fe-S-cluster containining protein